MKGLAQLWNQRQLAIVRGVGYPQPDHSHFRSMDIWQTASPAEPVSTGWIGRWLDATGDDPLRAVNIGPVLPPLAVGEKHTAAALSTRCRRRVRRGDSTRVMSALGNDDPDDTPAMAAVCKAYRAARTTDTTFASVKPAAKEHNSLATQLSMVADAVTARVPTRVYTVQLGGFDTHADERDTQQRLLQTFDEAVTRFLRQMADATAATSSCWHIRSSAAGCAPTRRRAPTTAPPARFSSRAHPSRAASTARSPASPTSTTET